jgi:hypothetical protein
MTMSERKLREALEANKAFMETWKLAISDYDNQVAENAKLREALEKIREASQAGDAYSCNLLAVAALEGGDDD